MKVRTNGHPRDILFGWDLTEDERKEFDYLDWDKIEKGEDQAEFFRYKGDVYDLGEFMTTRQAFITEPFHPFREWDGYMSDTYFSGIVVKYCDGFDQVIVGDYCT